MSLTILWGWHLKCKIILKLKNNDYCGKKKKEKRVEKIGELNEWEGLKTFPNHATPYFFVAEKPLILRILTKTQIHWINAGSNLYQDNFRKSDYEP